MPSVRFRFLLAEGVGVELNTLPNFNQNTPLLIPSIYLAHRFSSLKLHPQNILCLIIVVLCLFVLKYLLFCDIIVMVSILHHIFISHV